MNRKESIACELDIYRFLSDEHIASLEAEAKGFACEIYQLPRDIQGTVLDWYMAHVTTYLNELIKHESFIQKKRRFLNSVGENLLKEKE